MAKTEPSLDQWLAEAKADPKAAQCGMFLTHNGVVRVTPKKQVREGVEGLGDVARHRRAADPGRQEPARPGGRPGALRRLPRGHASDYCKSDPHGAGRSCIRTPARHALP